ncbi:MAG: DNA primase catalytic subunit PriS [Candidatus Hadarchaeales archaeon]
MIFREATPGERRRFYEEEWNAGEIPEFLLQTLHTREFGFDMDGTGPSHRYNQFRSARELEGFLRRWAPYSAYASVAMYGRPSAREGWMKAELALDIDAKDLPIKTCNCPQGKVCETCIDDARKIAIEFAETLREDLDLNGVYFVYSGRGFHIRISDERAMELEQSERGHIVEYVTGGVVPSDLAIALGYSRVFRERAARTLGRLGPEDLARGGIKRNVAMRLLAERDRAVSSMRSGRIEEISGIEGVGEKTLMRLLELLARINMQCTDGKVTVDTKRILRLPSSLHSGVSMKCVAVRDIEKFRLDDALPKFAREAPA